MDSDLTWVPWAIAAAAIVVAVAAVATRPARDAKAAVVTTRFSVPPPTGNVFYEDFETPGVAVSPDGSTIAFAATDTTGTRRAWLRPVGELEARSLPDTEGASGIFWSPDGRSLAFFTRGKLRRLDLRGGTAVTICDTREGILFSGTWGHDGQILFTAIEGEAIYAVSASGGTAAVLLKPDPAVRETWLTWPSFLPDGRHFLYLRRLRDGSGRLMLGDAGTPSRELMPLQSLAQYVEPGYLVFAADSAILGRRFDAAAGSVVGEPFSIAPSVKYFLSTSEAEFSASPSGTLAYQAHTNEQRLTWFDRAGRPLGTIGEPGEYKGLRFSPDARRLAFDRFLGGAYDVWETDLSRQAETRLTLAPSSEGGGPWMPDGRSLFFNADKGAPPTIFRKNLATGAEDPAVPASGTFQLPEDVSPDGKWLLFTQRTPRGGNDIWLVPADGSRPPSVVFETPFDENDVRFSPDGRFFSYVTNASGAYEVYVSPFPPGGERVRVSTDGAFTARWRRDGRELFYSGGGRVMAVPVQTQPSLRIGVPVRLFQLEKGRSWSGWDVSPDGRFLTVVSQTRATEQPLTVILNWPAELAR